MDIKEYIESGIIEAYVLGLTSDQERREVECMSAIYPELKQHILEIQHSFEQVADKLAKPAPPELKESILKTISTIPQDPSNVKSAEKHESKLITLPPQTQNTSVWKWGVAASIALLIGISVLYVSESSKQTKLKADLASLEKDKKAEIEKSLALKSNIEEMKNAEQLMLASSTISVKLAGTETSPNSSVRVFYNPEQKEAVLSMDALPQPDQDKQYQLWALVDGKPQDLGVFDLSTTKIGSIIPVEMSNISAFAITLEKKGGSPTPNLEQLFVIGNI